MRKSKIFCSGICRIWERNHRKCIDCGLYLCGICEFDYHQKIYCIDCFLKNATIIQDLKIEFKDMIKQIEEIKAEKKKKKYEKRLYATIKNEL